MTTPSTKPLNVNAAPWQMPSSPPPLPPPPRPSARPTPQSSSKQFPPTPPLLGASLALLLPSPAPLGPNGTRTVLNTKPPSRVLQSIPTTLAKGATPLPSVVMIPALHLHAQYLHNTQTQGNTDGEGNTTTHDEAENAAKELQRANQNRQLRSHRKAPNNPLALFPQQQQQQQQQQISQLHDNTNSTSNAICKFYQNGKCGRGSKCTYSHPEEPIVVHTRTLTPPPKESGTVISGIVFNTNVKNVPTVPNAKPAFKAAGSNDGDQTTPWDLFTQKRRSEERLLFA